MKLKPIKTGAFRVCAICGKPGGSGFTTGLRFAGYDVPRGQIGYAHMPCLRRARKKNPLAFAVDRKAGKVRATLTPPHVEVEIKPGKWIRWSRRNFPTVFAATKYARALLKKHRVLGNYGVRVVGGR